MQNLHGILKHNKKELVNYLSNDKSGSFESLRNEVKIIESENLEVNYFYDLLNNAKKTDNIYLIPSIEWLSMMKNIINYYKIELIEEINGKSGILSHYLNFNKINVLSSDDYKDPKCIDKLNPDMSVREMNFIQVYEKINETMPDFVYTFLPSFDSEISISLFNIIYSNKIKIIALFTTIVIYPYFHDFIIYQKMLSNYNIITVNVKCINFYDDLNNLIDKYKLPKIYDRSSTTIMILYIRKDQPMINFDLLNLKVKELTYYENLLLKLKDDNLPTWFVPELNLLYPIIECASNYQNMDIMHRIMKNKCCRLSYKFIVDESSLEFLEKFSKKYLMLPKDIDTVDNFKNFSNKYIKILNLNNIVEIKKYFSLPPFIHNVNDALDYIYIVKNGINNSEIPHNHTQFNLLKSKIKRVVN
jgi:hypothetical protein